MVGYAMCRNEYYLYAMCFIQFWVKRSQGRSKMNHFEVVKEDIQEEQGKNEVFDKSLWIIRYGDSRWEKTKEEAW